MNISSLIARAVAFAKREGKGIGGALVTLALAYAVIRVTSSAVEKKWPGSGERIKALFRA